MVQLIDKFRAWMNRGRVAPSAPSSNRFGGQAYGAFGDVKVNPDTATQVAAIWACMDVIAGSLASSDWNIYQGYRGEGNKKAIPRDRLQQMLNERWNIEMTAQAGKRAIMLNAVGMGTGYAEIEWDLASRPVALWPILTTRAEPRRDENGRLFTRFYQDGGMATVDIDNENLVILRGPSMSGFAGDNMLSRAIRTVANALALEHFSESYFANFAQLGTVFFFNGNLDDPAYERAKAQIEGKHAGVKRAYKTGFFEGGDWKVQTFGSNMDQSAFTEIKASTVDDVCFVPGTKVITISGPKPIEDVEIGESVLTHKGRWRRVTNTMTRPYEGEVITLRSKGLDEVTCTPEHRFFTQAVKPNRSNRQEAAGAADWVAAQDLDCGSWRPDGMRGRKQFHALTIPKLRHDVEIRTLDLAEWAPEGVIDETTVRVNANPRAVALKRFVDLDFQLGWLFGLYASDGSVGQHQVAFYLGAHETSATDLLTQILWDKFGLKATTIVADNVARTYVSSLLLRRFFADFGPVAYEKRFPNFCMAGGRWFREGLRAGLVDGDGCVYKGRHVVKVTSESLAWQLRVLLWTDGLHGALAHQSEGTWEIQGRTGVARNTYSVEWREEPGQRGSMGQTDENAYFNLQSVVREDYSGFVYNLEVDEDESYTTVGGCAHNCRWFHVPPHKIAHLAKSTNNNIEHQGLEFSRDTLRPWVKEIEQETGYKLISARGEPKFVEIDVDWTEQGDYKSRLEAYAIGRNMGVFSANDVLRKLGENTIGVDGDIRIVQGANVRLEDVGAAYLDAPGAKPKAEPDETLTAWLTTLYARAQRRYDHVRENKGEPAARASALTFGIEILADLPRTVDADRVANGLQKIIDGGDPPAVAREVLGSKK